MPWIVKLIKHPPVIKDDYREGFFPRRCHYKKDAEKLKAEVESKGGLATIGKSTKIL